MGYSKDHNKGKPMLNIATFFLDENIVQGRGERIAVYCKNKSYTYNQICEQTNRVGNALKTLGVEPQDRIYIVLGDSPEFVASFYGVIKIGAVATYAYTFLKPKDYAAELDLIRPKVVITDESAIDALREAASKVRSTGSFLIVGRSDLQENEFDFQRLTAEAAGELEPEPTSKDDIALWKFSGGTTGVRKAIPHRHANAVFAFESYNKIIEYRQDDIVLSVPKMFFGYGRDGTIVFPFRAGAAAVLYPERFSQEHFFKLINKYRPSILVQVPTAMRKILQTPMDEFPDLSSIRLCTSAGEALSKELYNEWKMKTGCEVLDGIGSAEMYYVYISNRLDNIKPGTLGKVTPGYEAKIIDEEGKSLSAGEIGVLAAKGGSSGNEYYHLREKTQQTFRGEWVHTDDLFSTDKEGYFRFEGRRDDLLKVSGIFISPYEIEKCIEMHAEVTECAVVGIEDKDRLIKSKAFVVLSQGIEPSAQKAEELKLHCKNQLSPHKFPRFVEFLEELPKTSLGKIARRQLKEKSI
jgi:benzoate-CoA ligase family protein